jgi:hypothetical protein
MNLSKGFDQLGAVVRPGEEGCWSCHALNRTEHSMSEEAKAGSAKEILWASLGAPQRADRSSQPLHTQLTATEHLTAQAQRMSNGSAPQKGQKLPRRIAEQNPARPSDHQRAQEKGNQCFPRTQRACKSLISLKTHSGPSQNFSRTAFLPMRTGKRTQHRRKSLISLNIHNG